MEDINKDLTGGATVADFVEGGFVPSAPTVTEEELRGKLIHHGRLLLAYRSDVTELERAIRGLESAFRHEHAERYAQLEQAKADEASAYQYTKQLTETLYRRTNNKKPLPGFSIRIVKRLTYDSAVALEWAKVNFRVAVKPESLDKTIFEKYVKGAKNPPEFVAFSEEAQVMISSVLADELAEATE